MGGREAPQIFYGNVHETPARDIDLGRDDDEQAAIEDLTAAQQLALDDFFTYAATRTDALADTDEFTAVRFHVTAQLAGRIFEQFILDIGFTNSIADTPDTITTSDLLAFAGIDPIELPALPLPQHLAEKLHAYTRTYGSTGRPSTRPKDLVRHPPDRTVRTDRRSRAQNSARGHLRRARPSAASRQTYTTADRMDGAVPPPRGRSRHRTQPRRRIRPRRRVPRPDPRGPLRRDLGTATSDLGLKRLSASIPTVLSSDQQQFVEHCGKESGHTLRARSRSWPTRGPNARGTTDVAMRNRGYLRLKVAANEEIRRCSTAERGRP